LDKDRPASFACLHAVQRKRERQVSECGQKITQKAEATSYCGYRQVASIARILAHSWTFLFFADGEYSLEFRIGLEKSDRRGIRQRHSSISKSCRTGGI